jgi:hypothetical protein
MKAVALGALSFAVSTAIPALVIPLGALLSQVPRRAGLWDDFLFAAYLVAVSSLLSTVGFLIPSALSATWRRLPGWRAVIIAGGLGLVGPLVGLLVAALGAPALLPLFRSTPRLATVLFHGLPGIVLGLAAVLVASAWRPTTPTAAEHRGRTG